MFVFFHGFPDSPRIWEKLVENLSRDSYFLIDLWIEVDRGNHSMESVTSSVIRQLGPNLNRPLIVVGHDIGAPFAAHFARMQKAAHLVLVNGITGDQLLRRFKNPNQIFKSWYIFALQIPGLANLVKNKFPKLVFNLTNKYKNVSENNFRALNGFTLYKSLFKNSFRQFSSLPPANLNVSVIWGKDDPFLLRPTREEFLSLSRDPKIYLLNCGHWPMTEQPEKMNYILSEIYQNLSPEILKPKARHEIHA
jgi:pimeloyl-ACP methyl ester carboxylesterase